MKTLFFLLVHFLLFTTSANAYLKIIYISDARIECNYGNHCLQIRNTPSESWTTIQDTITGFTYEEGNEYCLLVEVESNQNLDATFERLKLIEIKYKKASSKTDEANATASSKSGIQDSSRWMLYKLKRKDGTKTFSISKAFIQFNIEQNSISAFADCNGINASITIDKENIKFENITTTALTCGKKSIEPDFMNMLQAVTAYKVTQKLLYLYKDKSLLSIFTYKKN